MADVATSMTAEQFLEVLINKLKEEFMKYNMPMNLFLKIANKLLEHVNDFAFMELVCYHLNKVSEKTANENTRELQFSSHEDCIQYYTSRMFIIKLDLFPATEPHCIFQNNYPEQIDIVPIEIFFDRPQQKEKIEKSLKKFDVLYVRVTNCDFRLDIDPAPLFLTRMIYKEGEVNGWVYHLDIHIYLFKDHEAKNMPESAISVSSILKVCIIDSATINGIRHVFATTNPRYKNGAQLGRVDPSAPNLPFDVKLLEKNFLPFNTYMAYLRSHPIFYETKYLQQDIKSLGVDVYNWNTFSEHKIEFPADRCIDALEKKAENDMHLESQQYLEQACLLAGKKDFSNATILFKRALDCWPENPKVFLRRGLMYKRMMGKNTKRDLGMQAIGDFERALELNPDCQEAKLELSEIFAYYTKRFVKRHRNNFVATKKMIDYAFELNANNELTKKIKENVDKKIAVAAKAQVEIQKLQQEKEILQKKIKTEQ